MFPMLSPDSTFDPSADVTDEGDVAIVL
jgi:hypothetical protein